MRPYAKLLTIVALVGAVGGVMALKHVKDEPAPVANNQTPPAAQNQPGPSSLPRLLDVGADKCIPCKMMAPILQQLKHEYAGRVDVQFVDVWKNPSAKGKYAIGAIPTQIFYDASGKELFRHVGYFGKEDILAKWRELGMLPAAEKTSSGPN